VGDEDDAHVPGGHGPHELEHRPDLRYRESRSRLVEDQKARLEGHRACNRDRLPLTSGEVADRQVGERDPDVERVEMPARLVVHALLVKHRPAGTAGLAAEEYVASDIDVVAQRQILVDHLDPELLGLTGRRVVSAHPVDPYLAGVGRVGAGQHLHERRLSRGIIADETEHLARCDAEGDPAQGIDHAVPLADILHQHAVRTSRILGHATLHVAGT
jgi:hypothetical protein